MLPRWQHRVHTGQSNEIRRLVVERSASSSSDNLSRTATTPHHSLTLSLTSLLQSLYPNISAFTSDRQTDWLHSLFHNCVWLHLIKATTPVGYCPSTALLPVSVRVNCTDARRNRCQEDLNSVSFGELKETTRTPSYYVDEDYPARPEIQ